MPATVHSIEAGLAWCHLIEGAEGSILVDAGSRRHAGKIIDRIEAVGKPLRLIFITHAHLDHYGNAAAIRRATGAPVAVHRADADDLSRGATRLGSVRLWGHLINWALPLVERFVGPEPIVADIIIEDSDDLSSFGIPSRVVHSPGHTPGSCALIVEDETAFVGDLVSPMLYPHAQMLYATDWAELAGSLSALQALNPARVYSGHGGRPISGSDFARIKPPPIPD